MHTVRRLLLGRTLRGSIDGFVSVLLAHYLTTLGFSPFQVGAIVTATLVGSAVLTLLVGFAGSRVALTRVLVGASVLMMCTGIGFAAVTNFWPLVVIATLGTLNPSMGDVSVFAPAEQALLANHVNVERRTQQFAYLNLVGIFAGAIGALLSALPERIAATTSLSLLDASRIGFVCYGIIGLVTLFVYRPIPREALQPDDTKRALGSSRRIVTHLALLFSIDSAGSGLVVTAVLVLWLHLRFGLDAEATAAIFAASALLGALSQLAAPWLAKRIGMVRTMAYTHIPASIMLAIAACMPNGTLAVIFLLARSLFSHMDRPARQAFVMSVVPPEHRSATASITNVPRSLIAAITPLAAGAMLAVSSFGWPLLVAAVTKLVYDIVLLAMYKNTPEQSSNFPNMTGSQS